MINVSFNVDHVAPVHSSFTSTLYINEVSV